MSEFAVLRAKGEAALKAHQEAKFFSAEEEKTVQLLVSNDQVHLFGYWDPVADDSKAVKKHAMLKEIARLHAVCPLDDYARRARSLLVNSKEGVNPYEGWTPSVPTGVSVETTSAAGKQKFDAYEKTGEQEAKYTAFVCVAGGLGERLDYPGIKLALPADTVTGRCYIQTYIEYILALQHRAGAGVKIPLVIMTSGDTDAKTRQLLAEHKNFGMEEDQIAIVMQEKVPALSDNDAHFAVNPDDVYSLNTKPHGHGDVHTLLYRGGFVAKWAQAGLKWVVFFQDTNGLVFRAVPAALAVSNELKMACNSLTVQRKPGEAVGAIMRLQKGEGKDASVLTINVEYNQLELLVKKEPVDAQGYSIYPGNINVLILGIPTYLQVLNATGGIIGEFINPKYKDATKTTFKKDTRLECMMQDYPKLLTGTDAVVGFTQFERWLAFSAVKNSLSEAKAKQASKLAAESAATGEADLYYATRKILAERAGVKVAVEGKTQQFSGIDVGVGARVVLTPDFAVSQAEVAAKFTPNVSISPNSTLILNGHDINVKSLNLNGTLVVNAAPGAKVVIDSLNVDNKGWEFEPLAPGAKVEPKDAIRGYVVRKHEGLVVNFNQAGQFELSDKTKAQFH